MWQHSGIALFLFLVDLRVAERSKNSWVHKMHDGTKNPGYILSVPRRNINGVV